MYHIIMKFTLTTVLSFATIVVSSAHEQQNLRQQATSGVTLSACNTVTDQTSCYQTVDDESGLPCAWCVAGAIPSECVTQEQAKQLPESVFECSIPGETVYSFVTDRSHTFYAKEKDADDLCDASSKSLSGYMDIKGSDYDKNGQNKHLFYWMFEKRGDVDEDTPFIVWLTGGPGCSSTLALLTENGPCSVNPDGESTSINPYSWTEAAHVLWLDQPAGVGFSYGTEDDANEQMVGEDAYYFLQAFFQTYPQYAGSPLYVVGESYGGHYAPAIAHRVWMGNNHLKPNTVKLNLAGLGVGNGLTDPEEQYKWYPEMGHGANSHGISVFSDDEYETMKQAVPACTKLIHQCNKGDGPVDTFACQTAFITCNTALTSPYQATGLNPYDIRIKCEKPPLCYDFSNVKKFLNLPSTKQALGVDMKHAHAWNSCNFGINMKFRTDWMKTFAPFVSDLLNAGIPALIYAGDVDFICNYLGNKAWTLNLEWNGKEAFNAAGEHEWEGNGLARSASGLTFLQVYDGGHMVPADQPEVALAMIRNFVNGGEF